MHLAFEGFDIVLNSFMNKIIYICCFSLSFVLYTLSRGGESNHVKSEYIQNIKTMSSSDDKNYKIKRIESNFKRTRLQCNANGAPTTVSPSSVILSDFHSVSVSEP